MTAAATGSGLDDDCSTSILGAETSATVAVTDVEIGSVEGITDSDVGRVFKSEARVDSVVLCVLSSSTDLGMWGVLTTDFGLEAIRGRTCMDSGGDDDTTVLFSAALTGTIMIGSKGAIGEDCSFFSMTVDNLGPMPGSLDWGVGIAIYKQKQINTKWTFMPARRIS